MLIEAVFLSLIGGVIGGLIAWAGFDGYQTATMNLQSFSQVAFAFAVTPSLLVWGLLAATVMGLLGGLLPGLPRRPGPGGHGPPTVVKPLLRTGQIAGSDRVCPRSDPSASRGKRAKSRRILPRT